MRDPWLAAILALAAGLRIYGLGHGLPHVYNPDEANIMARALSIAQDPNPHYFLYPNLFFFFLFAVIGGLFVVGRMVGRYASLGAFEARFFEDPTDFYLAGRWVGVLAALVTIVLTYRLTLRHFGQTAARATALFTAVAYFHVRDSHYLKHDVPMGLLVVLALTAFDRIREDLRLRSYVLSGVAMGVAFATHYYAIFLAPAFALHHLSLWRLRHVSRVVAAGAVAALVFFLLSPFVLLELPVALDHMVANREVVMDRSVSGSSFLLPSLPAYLRFLTEQGLGYLLCALVLVGGVLMAHRDRARFVLWSGFPLFFFVFIAYTFFAGRYLNPILPSLAAAAGIAVGAIQERLGWRAAALVALAASIQPLYRDVQVDRLFGGNDTRTLAKEWIVNELPDGARVALQSYSVPVPQSAASIRRSLAVNDALGELDRKGKYSYLLAVAEETHPAYDLVFLGKGDEKDRTYLDYQDVVSRELDPLFDGDGLTLVLRYPPGPLPPQVEAFFASVMERGTELARITPFQEDEPERHPYLDNEDWPARAGLSYTGPLIEIWSLEKR
ncbi:MAG: ArnT family glycosyltransferase [Vicinamibacteria bacterium]